MFFLVAIKAKWIFVFSCRGKLDIPEVTQNDEVVEEEESRDVVSE